MIGYYLGPRNKCTPCAVGCADCNDGVFCKKCADGYTLGGASMAVSKCVKCDVSCATCFGSPGRCDSCATGYTEQGWSCFSGNRLTSEFKLDGDYKNFTTSALLDYKKSLAKLLGVTA